MNLKKYIMIGSQIVIALIVVPLLIYRGLFYFRPAPDPASFKASSTLIEHMKRLQTELDELRKEAEAFEVSDDPKAVEQRDERHDAMSKISAQLLDLKSIYQQEEEKMHKELVDAQMRQTRTYYDFALFVGTVWIIISSFIQVAFFKMGLNIFGLASVLIGTIGILSSIMQTPSLSMWLLMLFFSILAIAFLITGYQIAGTFKKGRGGSDKNI